MDPLARYLFRPRSEVVAELGQLSEADRIETVRRMLLFSRSTFDIAKLVMPELGLDQRLDLLELAVRSDPQFESHVRARVAPPKSRGVMTPETLEALKAMNVPRDEYELFLAGEPVQFTLHTPSGNETNGFLQLKDDSLASGILVIHDPGDGLRAFADFRERSLELARALGKESIELVGGAVTNQRLGRILVRQGFELSTVDIPDAYGGGEMEILSRRFPVRAEA